MMEIIKEYTAEFTFGDTEKNHYRKIYEWKIL